MRPFWKVVCVLFWHDYPWDSLYDAHICCRCGWNKEARVYEPPYVKG